MPVLSFSHLLSFVLLLLSLLPACVCVSYYGCYGDIAEIQKRSLPDVQLIDQTMNVDKCIQRCSAKGFPYSGVEYRFECYCGREAPPGDLALPEAKCSMECGTRDPEGRKCGGSLAISVYHDPAAAAPADDARPLVCLVMIVKNEGHTILDTLQTVRDWVDCWYILDTGSTDRTKEIISEYMAQRNIPGKIFEEPFVDYGATRNRILVLAKEHGNPIFTLMLSADERVENPQVMRQFLQDHRYSEGTMHGAYPVVMHTGLKFDSIRLARVDALWRYKARVHEYLAPPSGPYVGLYRSKVDINVQFNATDGPRRFQSQYFIKRILEEDLAKDPYDTRSIYYLARTNSGIDNHTEAYKYYGLLAERSKWDEEIYHGMVMKAIESKHLNEISWKERQNMFLDAFNYKPNSMDAIHALAQDHYDSGRPQLAFIFALRAVRIPPPPNLHSVENVLLRPTQYLYDYEGQRLLGFAARDIQEWEVCVSAFRAVLQFNPEDEIVKNRIALCEEKMKAAGKDPEAVQVMQNHRVKKESDQEQEKNRRGEMNRGPGAGPVRVDSLVMSWSALSDLSGPAKFLLALKTIGVLGMMAVIITVAARKLRCANKCCQEKKIKV